MTWTIRQLFQRPHYRDTIPAESDDELSEKHEAEELLLRSSFYRKTRSLNSRVVGFLLAVFITVLGIAAIWHFAIQTRSYLPGRECRRLNR